MSTLTEHLYIDTVDALRTLCASLRSKPYIAIDTEFLRERTYRPELCLIQVKQANLLACIDTLSIDDLSPFVELLMDETITKVFHAASQDLEIFYLLCKAVPKPIFDTQLAAPLLGYNEQIGYGNLVMEHLQISLPKTQTRADWTRRPLPASQIDYALDDVIHLESLYLDMHDKLTALGRLDWLKPEFEEWEKPEKYDQPAGERWKKIRNINRYKGPTLSIIQQLTKWREIKARELNRPRNWLLKDDTVLSIAQQKPDSEKDLAHIRGLDRKTRERFGTELLHLILSAEKLDPEPVPAFVKKQKLNATDQARLQLLNAWVYQRAHELNIAPGLLAPQKSLERMLSGDGQGALKGWRDSLLGSDLDKLLNGKASLSASSSGLKITASG